MCSPPILLGCGKMELLISVSKSVDGEIDLIQFRDAIKDLSALAKGSAKRTAKESARLHSVAKARAKEAAKKLIAKGIAIPKSHEANKLGLSAFFKGGEKDPSKG